MAVRGSPAKGVGWGDWREGSNPSFSAIYVHNSDVVHIVFFGENRLTSVQLERAFGVLSFKLRIWER